MVPHALRLLSATNQGRLFHVYTTVTVATDIEAKSKFSAQGEVHKMRVKHLLLLITLMLTKGNQFVFSY
jgi:hypothetical protein